MQIGLVVPHQKIELPTLKGKCNNQLSLSENKLCSARVYRLSTTSNSAIETYLSNGHGLNNQSGEQNLVGIDIYV